jgi:splicing factor 1
MSQHEIVIRSNVSSNGGASSSLAVYDDNLIRLSAGVARASGQKRKRKRFAPVDEKQYNPLPFVDLPIGLSVSDVDQFLREQRLDDISEKLKRNDLELGDPDIRPPSPPPAYDRGGARTNSRELRVKTSMQKEYHRLIAFMIKRVDGYVPPADYKPPKITKRVEIPQDRYPDINFTGMILGPRGLNHRRLEEESGCQFSIRGRGTRGQAAENQTEEELQMPLHVCIISDDEEKVLRGIRLIEPIVDPLHPDHEKERLKGLEQLALITGTTTSFQDRQLRLIESDFIEDLSYNKIDIVCKVCGDRGHVSSDCPTLKKTETIEDWRIDNEYAKLISEIGGSRGGTAGSGLAGIPAKASSHPLAMQTIPSHVRPPPNFPTKR